MIDVTKIDTEALAKEVEAIAAKVQKFAHLTAFLGNAHTALKGAITNLQHHGESEAKQAKVDEARAAAEGKTAVPQTPAPAAAPAPEAAPVAEPAPEEKTAE